MWFHLGVSTLHMTKLYFPWNDDGVMLNKRYTDDIGHGLGVAGL